MSRKNHKMIDGRLLQTNKKYSQLKMKQKEKIAEWMFQATRDYYMKKCTFPSDKHLEEVVDSVYEKLKMQKFGFRMERSSSIINPNDRISTNVSENL